LKQDYVMQERLTITPRVKKLIHSEVEKAMRPFGLKRVVVDAGEDHDGDPVIFIEATYDMSARAIDPDDLSTLLSRLRDKLWQIGETRFPHIRHRFPDRQTVVGYGRIANHGASSRKGKAKQSKTG
jgi:hypothetical protein